MTKKEKILKLFESAEWFEGINGKQCKIITYDDFYAAGLSPTIEYGDSYCDVIYARRILQKMGYQVLISSAFNVIKK